MSLFRHTPDSRVTDKVFEDEIPNTPFLLLHFLRDFDSDEKFTDVARDR